MNEHRLSRRAFAAWAASAGFAHLSTASAAPALPLADMHSHYGMFRRGTALADLRRHMEDTGTMLLAWALVDDTAWTRSSPQGIKQVRAPAPGELWTYFREKAARYDAQLRAWNLPKVLNPGDVDAALAGQPHVVMASESANFLEGQSARVAQAHAMGLRHLQLVHFIESPLADLQTEAPRHHGMTPVALQVIEECKRLGLVVDLAHSAPEFVDAALDQSQATMLWSHSWISPGGGTWRDWPNKARSLSPAQAKKIAAHGGLVGLWTVHVKSEPVYKVHDPASYADEILRMADLIGPQCVAFGTDMGGAGANPVMSNYGELREVADNLARRGVPETTLRDICFGNYARVLKRAMTV